MDNTKFTKEELETINWYINLQKTDPEEFEKLRDRLLEIFGKPNDNNELPF